MSRVTTFLALLAIVGIVDFLLNVAVLHFLRPDLPTQQRAQIEAFNSSAQHVVTTAQEFRATPETSAQVRSMGGIGEKPPAVISAGQQSSSWLKMQDELAALSLESIHRVVVGATHESLLCDKRL